jgi:hypothetical protein
MSSRMNKRNQRRELSFLEWFFVRCTFYIGTVEAIIGIGLLRGWW